MPIVIRLPSTRLPVAPRISRLLNWLPENVEADAAFVGAPLDVPEADAARLLDELEEAGCVASATGPVQ